MDVGDADVRDSVFPRAADPLLDLRERALMDLFDPRRMDPAVLDELLEREAGGFASHRVEAAQDHRLRGVVDDQVHAGGGLEGSDVPPLTADDSPLHVLARKGEHADRRLGSLLRGDALDRDRHDLARPLFAFLPGQLFDLSNLSHGGAFRVVDQLCQELIARLRRRHPGDRLQPNALLLGGLLQPDADLLELLVPLGQLRAPFLQLPGARPQLVLRLGDPPLQSRDLVAARLDVFLGVATDLRGVAFGLLQRTAERQCGLLLCRDDPLVGLNHLLLRFAFERVRAGSRDRVADQEPGADAHDQGDDADDGGRHGSSLGSGRGPCGSAAPVRSWGEYAAAPGRYEVARPP